MDELGPGGAGIDEAGQPALGSIHHDPGGTTAVIDLNPDLIGDRDDLWRSTAAHELGHAVFDAPASIAAAASHGSRLLEPARIHTRLQDGPSSARSPREMDWREWRANEFMGGFLAPRPLMRDHLLRLALELGLPLTLKGPGSTLPTLDGLGAGPDGIEALAIELAELFGLSVPFIHVRLRRYGLIGGV